MTRNLDRPFAGVIADFVKIPLVILTIDFRMKTANKAFCDQYQWKPFEVENQPFLEIFTDGQSFFSLCKALEQVAVAKVESAAVELDIEFTRIGTRFVSVELRLLNFGMADLMLVSIEDITRRKQSERELLDHEQELRNRVEAGRRQLDEASQMLRNEAAGRVKAETALYASESALFRSREELRHLSASLMNAQDAERRRVSRELHDDLSQKVARLQFDLEILLQKLPLRMCRVPEIKCIT